MSGERHARAFALQLVALVSLALLLDPEGVARPGSVPLRAGLLFWVPGVVVWLALRPREARRVDWVLLPSLLGALPVAAATTIAIRLGLSPREAAAATLIGFSVLLLALRPRLPRAVPGAGSVLAAALVLTTLLVAAPLAVHGLRADAWDGPLHAAVATRVQAGHVPPDSPLAADEPLHYYWLYHLLAAVVAEFAHVDLYQAFGLLNIFSFLLLALAGAALTRRLAGSSAQIAGMTLLILGLNGFGWLTFLMRAPTQADRWLALLVPSEMTPGEFPQLSSLVHLFLDGNPFPLSFAFALVFLAEATTLLERSGDRQAFLLAVLVLGGALHLHLLLGALLAAVSVLAACAANPRRSLPVIVAVAVAALATAPYALAILLHRVAGQALLRLSLAHPWPGLLDVLACLGPLALLAGAGMRGSAWSREARYRFLWICALVPMASYPVTVIAGGAQYKLLYLALLALAPLAAAGAQHARGRRVRFVAVALFLPTSLIMSLAFATKPPSQAPDAARISLLEWIRGSTPATSIFVEEAVWAREGRTDLEVLREDHLYFDIVIYARRRMLIGYEPTVLAAQWGHVDVPRRERLAARLLAGEPLPDRSRQYLRALSGPVFVVAHTPAADAEAFAEPTYRLVHEAPDARVYRLSP